MRKIAISVLASDIVSIIASCNKDLLIYPLKNGTPLIPKAPNKKATFRNGLSFPNPLILFKSNL